MENCKLDSTFIEIHNQAKACGETLARADERSRIFERLLPLEQYTDIILTGCGSSYNLARCAAFAWSEILSRPVRATASSELMSFSEIYLGKGAKPLIIAISRTGGTTEVRLAVERLRSHYGVRALAITAQPDSAVGAACDAEVAFTECREDSIVMTQAFACMLAGLYLIADGATACRYRADITRLPGLLRESLQRSEEVIRRLAEQECIKKFFFLGSGVMNGLADECALKMTEMALLPAIGHRSLEFRHGPKAALDEESLVVLFPVSAEQPHLEALLSEIEATEALMLLVGDAGLGSASRSPLIQLGDELPEVLRPALYAQVGQLLGYWRAKLRGLNPDSPRHLARTVLLDA